MKHKHSISVILMVFLIILVNSQKPNCEVYNVSSGNCEKCFNGYEIKEEENQCTVKIWAQIIGNLFSIRYVMPIFQIKSLFIDFIGEYWFISVNSSQETKSEDLSSLINAFNQESLWPFEIKRRLEEIIGDNRIEKYFSFMGVNREVSGENKRLLKKVLFLVDKEGYSFTTSCLVRLLISSIISLTLYLIFKILDMLCESIMGFKILPEMKGVVVLMISAQFYQFVSFYGFSELRSFDGYEKFGEKLNIGITSTVVFVFLFLSITLLPIFYSFNFNENLQNKNKSDKTLQKELNQEKKIHKFLAFSYSSKGFFYFLLNGPLRSFFIGTLVGYFSDSSFQYVITAFVYLIEYNLLKTIYKDFEEKTYFIFRKGFVIVTIIYLLLLYEECVHIFSPSTVQFETLREICLSANFIMALLDTLATFLQFIMKIRKTFQIWKSKNHHNNNISTYSNKIIQIRKHNREPSIAEKLLKRLKEGKDSEIMHNLQERKIIINFSAS